MEPQNNQNQPQPTSDNNMIMSILCYLGPLVLVSYFTSKDNPAVRFHVKQGLAVFGIEVIVWILGVMIYMLWPIIDLLNLVTLILSIVGIVNVVQNKQKELPFVGDFAKNLKV